MEAGVFDDIGAALMFRPGVYDGAWAPLTAQEQYRFAFHGRAAHPMGNPTEGVDALAALVELFNVLAVLGRRLPEGASPVQGVVEHGGHGLEPRARVRGGPVRVARGDHGALDEPAVRLRSCAAGVTQATGTTRAAERAGVRYEHFRDSAALSG